ncbi:ras-related protein Rab-7b isoform X4 [Phyllostomus hastatus]|nr:ras-related protein Rab-7b isoform X4 [Phyllostomus hastatus]
MLDDTTLKLQIWDTGGQERFRSMVSTFYKGSDGCILAFDVTDLESFEALDTWRGDVLAKIIPVEQSYPMVVLGNKIDLEDRQRAWVCPWKEEAEAQQRCLLKGWRLQGEVEQKPRQAARVRQTRSVSRRGSRGDASKGWRGPVQAWVEAQAFFCREREVKARKKQHSPRQA